MRRARPISLAALPQSGDSARARLAVRSWLWLMDGAILDWLEHRDLERAQLAAYLRCCLVSLLAAAGALADERDH